jgi:hypothetical protein
MVQLLFLAAGDRMLASSFVVQCSSLCCSRNGGVVPGWAGSKEVWEFLREYSELYGIASEGGFLRSVSAKIQGANSSMRR